MEGFCAYAIYVLKLNAKNARKNHNVNEFKQESLVLLLWEEEAHDSEYSKIEKILLRHSFYSP